MIRIIGALILVSVLEALVLPAIARPPFLELFKADPFRNPNVDGCSTCHLNPQGGGPRNAFGLAFAESGFTITPLLRANFPDRFAVNTIKLTDGSVLYMSDPKSQAVVLEKDNQKRLIELSPAPAPAASKEGEKPKSRFSFFVTSVGLGKGGNLGGIAGADRHCQALAATAGGVDRTWRAYLSTSNVGRPIINAGDRIGGGPWYNVKGAPIARGVVHLHSPNSNLNAETAVTEKGEAVNLSYILTGTRPDGTASDRTCSNWTSSSEESTTVGGASSWNSSGQSSSCSQESFRTAGGAGLFYCFAVD